MNLGIPDVQEGHPPSRLRGFLSRWLGSGSLKRSVLTLAGGSAFAQFLSMLLSPVLSRLYRPEDYGVVSVLFSLANTVAIVASLRYQLAITLPAEEERARQLAFLAMVLGVVSSAMAGLVLFVWGGFVLRVVGAPGLGTFCWLLPIILLGATFYEAANCYALRLRKYDLIVRTRIQQSVGGSLVSVGLGLLHGGPLGLVLGGLVNRSAGILKLGRELVRAAEGSGFKLPSRSGMATVAREYLGFAMNATGAGLLNAFGTSLPPTLVAAFFGVEVAGSFAFARGVVSLPMGLIGGAVSQVFLAEMSTNVRAGRSGEEELFRRVTRQMAKASVAVVLLGFTAPWAFPVVFGHRWAAAGLYAAVLCFAAAGQIIVSPISSVAVVKRRQGIQLWLDLLRAVAVVLSLWLPKVLGWSAHAAVAGFAVAMTGTYALSYCVYLRICKSREAASPGAPLS